MANGKIFGLENWRNFARSLNDDFADPSTWSFFYLRKACPKDFEYFDTIDDLGSLKVVKL